MNHTELQNTIGDLFQEHRIDRTEAVLKQVAQGNGDIDTRRLLKKWPFVRDAIQTNAATILKTFDPFYRARRQLRDRRCEVSWLEVLSRAYVRCWFGLALWQGKLDIAIARLETGFEKVKSGAQVPLVAYTQLVRVYSARDFFNLCGRA